MCTFQAAAHPFVLCPEQDERMNNTLRKKSCQLLTRLRVYPYIPATQLSSTKPNYLFRSILKFGYISLRAFHSTVYQLGTGKFLFSFFDRNTAVPAALAGILRSAMRSAGEDRPGTFPGSNARALRYCNDVHILATSSTGRTYVGLHTRLYVFMAKCYHIQPACTHWFMLEDCFMLNLGGITDE